MSLVGSSYAAARTHLKRARTAQGEALYYALYVYHGGIRGSTARVKRAHWDTLRSAHIGEALRIRRQIVRLRAELRNLSLNDTIPPQGDAHALPTL